LYRNVVVPMSRNTFFRFCNLFVDIGELCARAPQKHKINFANNDKKKKERKKERKKKEKEKENIPVRLVRAWRILRVPNDGAIGIDDFQHSSKRHMQLKRCTSNRRSTRRINRFAGCIFYRYGT
jgi:hypothetical protein